MTDIKLKAGQKWTCQDGFTYEVAHNSGEYVTFSSGGYCLSLTEQDAIKFVVGLAPKTVRKAQSVIKQANEYHTVGMFLAETEAEAKEHYGEGFVSWPLKVNGIAQWVEVPE